MKIRIEGLGRLEAALKKKAALRAVRQIVAKNTAELCAKMRQQAEFVKGYQTGATKASIDMRLEAGGLRGVVGPGTAYSPYLEYGTRHMQPQPFVGPAFQMQREQFKGDLKELI